MGNSKECGFYDSLNKIVYATAHAGENHQHELIHTINGYFPNCNRLLLTGISAYWGGNNAHFGKPLIYHIKRVNDYLISNPDIDLNNPTKFYQLDDKTNPQYVIGASLCDLALRSGGIEGLKKMFNCGSSDTQLLDYIKNELLQENIDLNKYLRERISEIANDDKFDIYEL